MINHNRWLEKRGLTRDQVKMKKKRLGSPNVIPIFNIQDNYPMGNNIPQNGTKSPDTSLADFSRFNHPIAPAYNKGPLMVMTRETIQYAGKK